MSLYKNKYRSESTRLQGYDYSSPGAYFVTIVTRNRIPFFGKITNGNMEWTETGEMAKSFWAEIPDHFPNVRSDEFIVMPNHVHGIVMIVDDNTPRRDAPRRDAINRVPTGDKPGGVTGIHNPMLSMVSLPKIIRWYKGRCSYEIHRMNDQQYFGWQSRYHDRIIRDEAELNRRRTYIINNPANWNPEDLTDYPD